MYTSNRNAFLYLPGPVLYANTEGGVNALNAAGNELLLQAKISQPFFVSLHSRASQGRGGGIVHDIAID